MADPSRTGLARRLAVEALGTGLLVLVVGSGTMAARLSPDDVGLPLLENALATAGGLAVIIVVLEPASVAPINSVVTLYERVVGRLTTDTATGYVAAQVVDGSAEAVFANPMFEPPR